MKKVAAFVALSLLMAGCVSNDKIAVTPEQLQHHRFVLERYRIALRKYQHYQRQTCTGLVQKSSSLPASDIY